MFKSTPRPRATAGVLPRGMDAHPFHAVEICSGPEACAAARSNAGHRFLSRQPPPSLPLPQCDHAVQCTCRYRHHEDRRAGPRRSVETGRPPTPWVKGERRARRGRRHDD